MGRTGATVHATKSRRIFFATNAPDPPHWTLTNVLVQFIKFGCIWDRLVDLRNSVQNGPNWCKSSCHEAVSEFFSTNAPIKHHWTLNSCFSAFRTILVHLGQFGWVTKLGAKRAELEQKFVVRSRIEIFRNEHTRSIPLDPKLIFWCLSYNFGALEIVWLTYNTRCKTGRTGAKVHATKSLRNFSQRTQPIQFIGP